MPRQTKGENTKLSEELQIIIRLLILQLLNDGMSGRSIAKFLEMDPANFSKKYRMRGVQFKKRS